MERGARNYKTYATMCVRHSRAYAHFCQQPKNVCVQQLTVVCAVVHLSVRSSPRRNVCAGTVETFVTGSSAPPRTERRPRRRFFVRVAVCGGGSLFMLRSNNVLTTLFRTVPNRPTTTGPVLLTNKASGFICSEKTSSSNSASYKVDGKDRARRY